MRWSSLNSLLFVLLASVAFDGILARPLPDTDAIYPRAPTNPPKGKQGTFLIRIVSTYFQLTLPSSGL